MINYNVLFVTLNYLICSDKYQLTIFYYVLKVQTYFKRVECKRDVKTITFQYKEHL